MRQELALIETLISNLLSRLRRAHVEHVEEICFRRCSTFSGEVLEQEFRRLTVGTPLEYAQLVVEVKAVNYACECGYQQVVRCDDLVGDHFTCPRCGRVEEFKDLNPLELLEVDDADVPHHRHTHLIPDTSLNPQAHV